MSETKTAYVTAVAVPAVAMRLWACSVSPLNYGKWLASSALQRQRCLVFCTGLEILVVERPLLRPSYYDVENLPSCVVFSNVFALAFDLQILKVWFFSFRDIWWRSWLRYCSTNRKVTGSISVAVIGIFHWPNPSGRTMALRSTQPLTEMRTKNSSWG